MSVSLPFNPSVSWSLYIYPAKPPTFVPPFTSPTAYALAMLKSQFLECVCPNNPPTLSLPITVDCEYTFDIVGFPLVAL